MSVNAAKTVPELTAFMHLHGCSFGKLTWLGLSVLALDRGLVVSESPQHPPGGPTGQGYHTAVPQRQPSALCNMSRHVDERTRELADASSKPILALHVKPTDDIEAERGRASFDSEEVAVLLHGGREKLQRK